MYTRLIALALFLAAVALPQGVVNWSRHTGWVAAGGAPTPTPTHRWIFSEESGTTVADQIGSNTLTFGASTADPAWVSGGGVDIDGNDYLVFGTDLSLDWINEDVTVCWTGSHGDTTGRHGYLGNWDGDGYWFSSEGTQHVEFILRQVGGAGDYRVDSSSGAISAGVYYHVCMVKPAGIDATDLELYVDGVGVAETVTTNTFSGSVPSQSDRIGTLVNTVVGLTETHAVTVWEGSALTAPQIADWCAEDETLLDGRGKTTPWGCN